MDPSIVFRPIYLMAALIIVPGCASTARVTPVGCTSDLAPAEQPLAEALDSANLGGEIAALWGADWGLVLASISYDSVGLRDTVYITAASLPAPLVARLQQAVSSVSRDRAMPAERVYLVLGDGAGPGVRRVARFAGCAPTLLRRTWLTQEVQAIARNLNIRRRLTAMMMVHVQLDGTAGAVEIDGSSGDPLFDQAAAQVLKRATFTPGMVEGIPVAVWARFPVTAAPARGEVPAWTGQDPLRHEGWPDPR